MSQKDVEMQTKLQWWIMVALWAVVLTGGSAWANHIDDRISRLESYFIHPREWDTLMERLNRMESKLDYLAEVVNNKK